MHGYTDPQTKTHRQTLQQLQQQATNCHFCFNGRFPEEPGLAGRFTLCSCYRMDPFGDKWHRLLRQNTSPYSVKAMKKIQGTERNQKLITCWPHSVWCATRLGAIKTETEEMTESQTNGRVMGTWEYLRHGRVPKFLQIVSQKMLCSNHSRHIYKVHNAITSVLWHCWLHVRKSIWPVIIEWWSVSVVICLEGGADCLHMVRLMPLPSQNSIISCIK